MGRAVRDQSPRRDSHLRPWLVRALAVLFVLAVAWAACPDTSGERLPLTSYTTADGLGSDRIRKIVSDSRGFLWICHRRGVSRFDGTRFVSYGTRHGLPAGGVYDLLETRSGQYLLATLEGLFLFHPLSLARPFVPVGRDTDDPIAVHGLVEEPSGIVWAVARDGLYRLEVGDETVRGTKVLDAPVEAPGEVDRFRGGAIVGRDGSLWLPMTTGLLRRLPGGEVEEYGEDDGLPFDNVLSVFELDDGTILAGVTGGIARFDPTADGASARPRWIPVPVEPPWWVFAFLQDDDGALWVGTGEGLYKTSTSWADPRPYAHYTTANGMTQNQIAALARDREGNVWIGTESAGLMRLSRGGLTSWLEPEGLEETRIASIFETLDGTLFAYAGSRLYPLRGGRFAPVELPLPVSSRGWGWHQWILQDHLGDWWVPTAEGVFRFSGVPEPEDLATARPESTLTRRDGLPSDSIFRLYEDSRGDVWISTISAEPDYQLSRWERRTDRIYRYGEADGIPIHAPTAFREDAVGNLWIGFYDEGVARHRDGRFRRFTREDGVPPGLIRSIHLDRRGRIWIAADGGLARVDDPDAERPAFARYGTVDGLSSDLVSAITEDRFGNIYLGTDRGIDRLDPESGAIRPYTAADGLPNSFVNAAYRDRDGGLWFGTLRGIARLIPRPEQARPVLEVAITAVGIAGEPHEVSALGETEVRPVRIPAARNRVRIEFGAVAFDPGERPRFQYRLEGASGDWSEPSDSRWVDYANLAPGSYRFAVRSIGPDGALGESPASFAFTVAPPFWRTGWFLGAVALAIAGVALAVHRLRVARAVEMERVRTRIATDLHDDIGSSLSRIAILTELLQRKVDPESKTVHAPLERIAGLSRELVDSMSDIVWAINPKRDRWSDIVFRMRRFAADAFTGREIDFAFHADPVEGEVRLGPDVRREVYLVFKESVNNTVRHSGCRRAEVRLGIAGQRLRLEVRDDGNGFDPEEEFEGQGLTSMRRRVERLGGTLEIDSDPGEGTRVRFDVPVGGRPRATYMNLWGFRRKDGVD